MKAEIRGDDRGLNLRLRVVAESEAERILLCQLSLGKNLVMVAESYKDDAGDLYAAEIMPRS